MNESIADKFQRRAMMAPMAGVNTPAFCLLLKERGAEIIYTALLTSFGIKFDNRKSNELLSSLPRGVFLVGQIFGAAPEVMAEAAGILESTGKFSAIDINMGCPVPKVVKSCAGAGLMTKPELAAGIVRAVAAAVKLPVTVKLRAGWDSARINCVEMARICEGEGAAAAAVHPRTRAQGFKGRADWTLIAEVKQAVAIPVVASGDIANEIEAALCIERTGCDSVMIGRAAMGDPGLIGRVDRFLQTGAIEPPPDSATRLANARRQLRLHVELEGDEKRAVREMRGPLSWYAKGLPGASAFRSRINTAESLSAMESLINEFEVVIQKHFENGPREYHSLQIRETPTN